MNKIKLYVALFTASMLLSTTFSIVYATENQSANTVVTYVQPAEENIENVYEVIIPSTATFETGKSTMTMSFSLSSSSVLADDYIVHLDLDPKTFTTLNSVKNLFVMYTDDQKYHRANVLYNTSSNGKLYYNNDTSNYLTIATFGNSESNTTGGSLKLSYDWDNSNDTENTEGGTYTGTLYFNIYGNNQLY